MKTNSCISVLLIHKKRKMLEAMNKKIIYYFSGILVALLLMLCISKSDVNAETIASDNMTASDNTTAQATKAAISIKTSTGKNTSALQDVSYATNISCNESEQITITSQEMMQGIYIEWAKEPSKWTLTYNGQTMECGTSGFLHEYVAIPDGATSVTMILSKSEKICGITGYSTGILPADVERWKPTCEKADILVLSTHADDELLFLGGVLAEYAGQEKLAVQVVYFSNYYNGAVIREHEKLDGLWAAGVKNYPVTGNFDDIYAADLASAEKIFGYDKTLSFVVEQIRRFKPQVCVGQDVNGEYGHGTHMLTSKALQEATTISMDATKYPESVEKYGIHDVEKTYIHLYPENKLYLDCKKPLSEFGGKNAVEVAQEAYKKHVSQQWCWFYVSDSYEYSCADFGLYRTTVGNDTGNDMMEHVISYEEQAKQQLEAQEQAKQQLEAKEQASVLEAESLSARQQNIIKDKNILKIVMVYAGVIIAFGLLIAVYIKNKNKKKQNRRK